MASHNHSLEEILDALMLEEERPDFQALTRWTERYPEHANDLARFFVVWARQESCSEEVIVDEEALARRGVSYALNVLHRQVNEGTGPQGAEVCRQLIERPSIARKAQRSAGLMLPSRPSERPN